MQRRTAERLAWLGMLGLFAGLGMLAAVYLTAPARELSAVAAHMQACATCVANARLAGFGGCPVLRRLNADLKFPPGTRRAVRDAQQPSLPVEAR